jgi:hypothetical protein
MLLSWLRSGAQDATLPPFRCFRVLLRVIFTFHQFHPMCSFSPGCHHVTSRTLLAPLLPLANFGWSLEVQRVPHVLALSCGPEQSPLLLSRHIVCVLHIKALPLLSKFVSNRLEMIRVAEAFPAFDSALLYILVYYLQVGVL